MQRTPQRKPKSDPWYGWALVALAALVFTNAAWFYNWQVRAADHAQQLSTARTATPPPERVIYEYRRPQQAEPRATQARHQQPTRTLVAGEECFRGTIFRRSAAGIESTGEGCQP